MLTVDRAASAPCAALSEKRDSDGTFAKIKGCQEGRGRPSVPQSIPVGPDFSIAFIRARKCARGLPPYARSGVEVLGTTPRSRRMAEEPLPTGGASSLKRRGDGACGSQKMKRHQSRQPSVSDCPRLTRSFQSPLRGSPRASTANVRVTAPPIRLAMPSVRTTPLGDTSSN
jgi:hypothetical protein